MCLLPSWAGVLVVCIAFAFADPRWCFPCLLRLSSHACLLLSEIPGRFPFEGVFRRYLPCWSIPHPAPGIGLGSAYGFVPSPVRSGWASARPELRALAALIALFGAPRSSNSVRAEVPSVGWVSTSYPRAAAEAEAFPWQLVFSPPLAPPAKPAGSPPPPPDPEASRPYFLLLAADSVAGHFSEANFRDQKLVGSPPAARMRGAPRPGSEHRRNSACRSDCPSVAPHCPRCYLGPGRSAFRWLSMARCVSGSRNGV